MDHWASIILISFGACLGANLRVAIITKLAFISIENHWITCSINIISSFFFGFLIALFSNYKNIGYPEELFLFSIVGFLGGLSTFSTFIFDLFKLLKTKKFQNFFLLAFFSITLGVLAAYLGYWIGFR